MVLQFHAMVLRLSVFDFVTSWDCAWSMDLCKRTEVLQVSEHCPHKTDLDRGFQGYQHFEIPPLHRPLGHSARTPSQSMARGVYEPLVARHSAVDTWDPEGFRGR